MAPVALRVEVAQPQQRRRARLPRSVPRAIESGALSDPARHEVGAAARRFVVEQDAVARKQAIRLAHVHRVPVGGQLARPIGRPRVECVLLGKGLLVQATVHLRSAGLVEAGVRTVVANRLEDIDESDEIGHRRRHRIVKGVVDERLRREVVALVEPVDGEEPRQQSGIFQLALNEGQRRMALDTDQVLAPRGCPSSHQPDDMLVVPVQEQVLGEVRPVLTRDSSDNRGLHPYARLLRRGSATRVQPCRRASRRCSWPTSRSQTSCGSSASRSSARTSWL